MPKTNTPFEREFFDAVAHGQIESVKAKVKTNPELLDAFDYNCFGATPVTRVCFHENQPMLAALIELGADVNRRSDWEMGPWSPLHCATHNADKGLAEYLLENGATMDLHSAAGLGRADELQELIEAAPERVSERGGDGCQPLHFADTVEVAQLLLDHGADTEARCVDHYSTPVQYLCLKRPSVARYLNAKGAQTDIFSAIIANDREVVQSLIEADENVLQTRINQQSFPPGTEHDVHNIMTFFVGKDCTPIHAAARGNQPDMIEMLVELGADPNAVGGYDDGTPLHIAAWNDFPESVTALADHGADLDKLSGEIHSNSPAGWAIVAGSCKAFEILIDRGAKIQDWFLDSAQAALNGEFLQYKRVPQENYRRIAAKIKESSK